MKDKENFILRILDLLPFAVLVVDEQEQFYYANDLYFHLFQMPRGKLARKGISELLPSQLLEDEQILTRISYLRKIYQENPQIMEIPHFRWRVSETEDRFIKIHILPVPSQKGMLTLMVFEDYTGAHGKEMEVLQQARLLALGEMAAGIAHELNNFLTILMGHLDLAAAKNKDASVEPHLKLMRQQVETMVRFATSVLNFSRQNPVEKQPVHLSEIIEDTLRFLLARLHQNSLDVKVQLESEKDLLMANKSQLQQLLINLLLNSKKSTGPGGQIIIRVWNKGNDAILEIQDNGEGIPDEIKDRIFNPFFTTRLDGSGLGLNICKKIVQNHAARIEFDSQVGKGTTFRVIFPLLQEAKNPIP